MTGKTLYKKFAFKESAYADRKLDNIMAQYITARTDQARAAKKEHWVEEQRARVVRAQRGKNFFLSKYFQAEVEGRRVVGKAWRPRLGQSSSRSLRERAETPGCGPRSGGRPTQLQTLCTTTGEENGAAAAMSRVIHQMIHI